MKGRAGKSGRAFVSIPPCARAVIEKTASRHTSHKLIYRFISKRYFISDVIDSDHVNTGRQSQAGIAGGDRGSVDDTSVGAYHGKRGGFPGVDVQRPVGGPDTEGGGSGGDLVGGHHGTIGPRYEAASG